MVWLTEDGVDHAPAVVPCARRDHGVRWGRRGRACGLRCPAPGAPAGLDALAHRSRPAGRQRIPRVARRRKHCGGTHPARDAARVDRHHVVVRGVLRTDERRVAEHDHQSPRLPAPSVRRDARRSGLRVVRHGRRDARCLDGPPGSSHHSWCCTATGSVRGTERPACRRKFPSGPRRGWCKGLTGRQCAKRRGEHGAGRGWQRGVLPPAGLLADEPGIVMAAVACPHHAHHRGATPVRAYASRPYPPTLSHPAWHLRNLVWMCSATCIRCFFHCLPLTLSMPPPPYHTSPLVFRRALSRLQVWARNPSEEALMLSARRTITSALRRPSFPTHAPTNRSGIHPGSAPPRVVLVPWSIGKILKSLSLSLSLYTCMHACMHACMRAYMHTHIHTHILAYTPDIHMYA